MRTLPRFPADYFLKFSKEPVRLKPFNPKSIDVAQKLIKDLKVILHDLRVEIVHRGSTAFGVIGKGDIEIGIYPTQSKDWSKILDKLRNRFGEAENIEENYVRFNGSVDGFEIEIIVLKGQEAKTDLAITKYLLSHQSLLKEYKRVKTKYAYSKREYQKQKDLFFRRVTRRIPDE